MLSGATGAALVGYLVTAQPVLLALLLGATGAVGLAFLAWHKPHVALLVLVALVPFNPVAYGAGIRQGVPVSLMLNLSYWKELLLFVLTIRLLFGRRSAFEFVDYVALAYAAIIAAYVAIGLDNPFARLVAAREDGAFVLVFLVARHVPMPPGAARRVEGAILVLGVIFATVGIYARFNYLDYALFAYNHLGLIEPAFKTSFGTTTFARAGALFGSPVNLGFFLLIPVGVAVAGVIAGRGRTLYSIFGAVAATGVLFTVTRSAIMGMGLMVGVAMLATRRRVRVALTMIGGAILTIPFAGTVGLSEGLSAGTNSANPETANHISALQTSLSFIGQHPLGTGLGTAGHVFQRFQVAGGLTNESWYFQLATEIGVAGMALFILLLLLVAKELWVRARMGVDIATAALCGLTALAFGGFFLHSFEDLGVAIGIWALVGLGCRRRATVPEPEPVLPGRTASINRLPRPAAPLS